MEQRLEEFRALKRRQQPAGQPEMRTPAVESQSPVTECCTAGASERGSPACDPPQPAEQRVSPPESSNTSRAAPAAESPGWLRAAVLLLKLALWLALLGLFSELQFGLPFFLLSLFYWLYEGLRSPRRRQPGELSAYSVFNPQCQPLLGTLTAQQLEGEMGYRPLGDR
ncbi:SAYSvFN domain-containing protein 1 [Lepisosteus oculatus]|uniref:SAYSvFN domain-containing protein 1 n=1 Tax=Lepisosteus oculatus TaxID=7918 RepID=UPI0035F51924